KFDFLGLKTLTVIDNAVRLINERPGRGEQLRISDIPIDDERVYRLISEGDTWGVFQLESRGFTELLKRLQPDRFEDIVAAVALYRPGPLEGGMVDQFVECKHGRREITYLHPKLEGVLKETYGVIVYQEQVMQAAQILAGYSLGAADIMRRAMGKKKKEAMEKERLKFVAGAEKLGTDAKKAHEIFELINKFAGYGFNKSHSAAYALITYQTAWLKTHYPVEFLAALLTCDRENTDKVARYIRAGRERGIRLSPPDVNRSARDFSVLYQGDDAEDARILCGLGAIKGVGDAALLAIFEARQDGEFTDIYDFAGRVDSGKVNRSVVESLIRAGAFDSMSGSAGVNRGRIFGALDRALERGRAAQRDRETGQTNLFGALLPADPGGDLLSTKEEAGYDDFDPWDERTQLAHEKASVGFYMSGHPMERYAEEAARLADCNALELPRRRHGDRVSIAGMVMEYGERTTKAGKRMAIFSLEDLEGRVEVVVYSEALMRFAEVLTSEEPLFVNGMVRVDQGSDDERRSIILNEAYQLQDVRSKRTREVHVHLDASAYVPETAAELKTILEANPGRCDAFIEVVVPRRSVTTVALPEQFRVAPSDELLRAATAVRGVKMVELR
ncbi:MAG: DNA polymerase III subunit alpha, partial [Deltaproteobacteria bacterium]|nr:DNA polymerase III subunit alpha [Deltaproteobacteria bacterium]MBW2537542.1 DNA polymerase III subunit alpha [Deltaproteobacteria bacterium]